MGAPNPDVTALVQQLALQHWTVSNTPDLTGVIAAVNQQLGTLGGEINAPLIAFANAQLDALFAVQEATESAHGSSLENLPSLAVGTALPPQPGVLLQVSNNTSPLQPPAAGTLVQIAAADGVSTRLALDAYGGGPSIQLRASAGTAAIPLPIVVNALIGTLQFVGRTPTVYAVRSAILAQANENWTATAQGADLSFTTTAAGTVGAAEKQRIRGDGALIFPAGNSTGAPGNATINLATGRSAIAAGAATVTITNSLVSATSLVFAVLQTNDATAILKNVVPGAGSFVVNLTAAATGNTNFGWWAINT